MQNLFRPQNRNHPRMPHRASAYPPVQIDAGEDALQPGSNDRVDLNPYTGASTTGCEIEVLPDTNHARESV